MSELTREQLAGYLGMIVMNSSTPTEPILAAFDALRDRLAQAERERDAAVAIAKGLTEPTPITDADIGWATTTLSQVEMLQQQLSTAQARVKQLEAELQQIRSWLEPSEGA